MGFGFDITDEGFYLNSIKFAQEYSSQLTSFGAIFHPLFIAVSGDVVNLRRLVWIVSYSVFFILFWSILRVKKNDLGLTKFRAFLLASCFAVSVLQFSRNWLLSPNYNIAALIALAIFMLGVLTLTQSRHLSFGAFLVSIGGVLAAFVKLPLAFCLAIYFFFLVLILPASRSVFIKTIVASILLFSLMVFLFWGGPGLYIEDLTRAYAQGSHLVNERESLFAYLSWHGGLKLPTLMQLFKDIELVFLLVNFLLLFVTLAGFEYFGKRKSRVTFLVYLVLVITTTLLLYWASYSRLIEIKGKSATLSMVLVWLIVSVVVLLRMFKLSGSAEIDKRIKPIILLSLVSPYFYAFGSSNNYWHSMSLVSIFVYVALILMSKDRLWVYAIAAFSFVQTSSSSPLLGGSIYRQSSLEIAELSNFTELEQGALAGVSVSPELDQYFKHAKATFSSNGYRGENIIDLTGASPGLIYFLGGRSAGAPWLLGGYPGSEAHALVRLSSENKNELSNSWVITENWRRAIDPKVLDELKLNLKECFSLTSTISLPPGVGGRKFATLQRVYRPLKMTERPPPVCQ